MTDTVYRASPGNNVRAILVSATALALAIPFWLLVALPYFTIDAASFGHFPEVFWPRRYELLLHIAGGTIALLAGPVQLWLGLTRRGRAWHRMQGRVYVAGVALGAASAFYLALTSTAQLGWVYATGLFCLALAWTMTTAMACVAIRWREIEQHREWMIRSYVVTFAFVIFRLLISLFEMLDIGTLAERYSAAAWLCWALPLLIAEPVLQWRKIRSRTKASPKVSARQPLV